MIIPWFQLKLRHFVSWPSLLEWQQMQGVWPRLEHAFDAIDCTSHPVCRPSNEPQEQYYSHHRNRHVIHSQVIVDNGGLIRHVESGFLGHQSDAQQFYFMRAIGGPELPFPDECYLLGDKIYPNVHPIMTQHTSPQLRRMPPQRRRKARKLNRCISANRIAVEHAINEIKTYMSISTVWRHRRSLLPRVVYVCTCLVNRKKDLGIIM